MPRRSKVKDHNITSVSGALAARAARRGSAAPVLEGGQDGLAGVAKFQVGRRKSAATEAVRHAAHQSVLQEQQLADERAERLRSRKNEMAIAKRGGTRGGQTLVHNMVTVGALHHVAPIGDKAQVKERARLSGLAETDVAALEEKEKARRLTKRPQGRRSKPHTIGAARRRSAADAEAARRNRVELEPLPGSVASGAGAAAGAGAGDGAGRAKSSDSGGSGSGSAAPGSKDAPTGASSKGRGSKDPKGKTGRRWSATAALDAHNQNQVKIDKAIAAAEKKKAKDAAKARRSKGLDMVLSSGVRVAGSIQRRVGVLDRNYLVDLGFLKLEVHVYNVVTDETKIMTTHELSMHHLREMVRRAWNQSCMWEFVLRHKITGSDLTNELLKAIVGGKAVSLMATPDHLSLAPVRDKTDTKDEDDPEKKRAEEAAAKAAATAADIGGWGGQGDDRTGKWMATGKPEMETRKLSLELLPAPVSKRTGVIVHMCVTMLAIVAQLYLIELIREKPPEVTSFNENEDTGSGSGLSHSTTVFAHPSRYYDLTRDLFIVGIFVNIVWSVWLLRLEYIDPKSWFRTWMFDNWNQNLRAVVLALLLGMWNPHGLEVLSCGYNLGYCCFGLLPNRAMDAPMSIMTFWKWMDRYSLFTGSLVLHGLQLYALTLIIQDEDPDITPIAFLVLGLTGVAVFVDLAWRAMTLMRASKKHRGGIAELFFLYFEVKDMDDDDDNELARKEAKRAKLPDPGQDYIERFGEPPLYERYDVFPFLRRENIESYKSRARAVGFDLHVCCREACQPHSAVERRDICRDGFHDVWADITGAGDVITRGRVATTLDTPIQDLEAPVEEGGGEALPEY